MQPTMVATVAGMLDPLICNYPPQLFSSVRDKMDMEENPALKIHVVVGQYFLEASVLTSVLPIIDQLVSPAPFSWTLIAGTTTITPS